MNGKDKLPSIEDDDKSDDDDDIDVSTLDQDRAVFICSKNKETELCAMEAFKEIVEQEKFKQSVLITTSVLDNGINIKDKDVHNMVIDVYDRTEFLQMLGRLRMENDEQRVHLYIKEYTDNDLKSTANYVATNLIQRLKIELLNKSKQMEEYKRVAKGTTIFDDDMFCLLNNSPIMFCFYNSNAIYQLIDYLGTLISIIREKQPDFVIHYESDEAEVWRSKIVDFYWRARRDISSWSRNIVDLLGSKEDMKKRMEYEKKDLIQHIFPSRYEYTTSDSFANFLFSEAIPERINRQIMQLLDSDYFNRLSSEEDESAERNLFVSMLAQITDRESNCPAFEVWKKIYARMEPKEQKRFEDLSETLAHMKEKIDFYKKIARTDISEPTDIQFQWIGKSVPEPPKKPDDVATPYYEFIKKRSVTKAEFETAKIMVNNNGNPYADGNPRFKKDFLESKGVSLKFSNLTREEKWLLLHYLGDENYKNEKGRHYPIDEKEYEVVSCMSKANNAIYYMYVEVEPNDPK